ncbi:MAG: Kae1-associated serine/threonine protein kinase [Candidatus Lokiarchaeota archaeon]|nr:Kae1-associated serine/threonine protein kinase [Candidatus Lokiarchaeota archaeon]
MKNNTIVKEDVMHKGAEASLIHGFWFGKEVIFKQRYPKKYRIEPIDKQIRVARTLNEARALIKVKNYGLNVPQVFEIDVNTSTIIMKYIEGEKLKDLISVFDDGKKNKIFYDIGRFIAKLHQNGHIHGDITTSNIIITPNDEIFFIDFGLHEYSDSIEDKSVDLHLFKRVLISSHGSDFDKCFKAFISGYLLDYDLNGSDKGKYVVKNINSIESRGRYVKQEERK